MSNACRSFRIDRLIALAATSLAADDEEIDQGLSAAEARDDACRERQARFEAALVGGRRVDDDAIVTQVRQELATDARSRGRRERERVSHASIIPRLGFRCHSFPQRFEPSCTESADDDCGDSATDVWPRGE